MKITAEVDMVRIVLILSKSSKPDRIELPSICPPRGKEKISQFLRYSSSKCYLTLLRRHALNLAYSFTSKFDGSSSLSGK